MSTNSAGYHNTMDVHLKRLWRIEGQVPAVYRVVGQDTDCIDVPTQVPSVLARHQAERQGVRAGPDRRSDKAPRPSGERLTSRRRGWVVPGRSWWAGLAGQILLLAIAMVRR